MIKLIGVLILHLLCLVMLILPDNMQGPVMLNASGVNLRTMDIAAIVLIISGSVYLFSSVLSQYKAKGNLLQELKRKDSNKSKD